MFKKEIQKDILEQKTLEFSSLRSNKENLSQGELLKYEQLKKELNRERVTLSKDIFSLDKKINAEKASLLLKINKKNKQEKTIEEIKNSDSLELDINEKTNNINSLKEIIIEKKAAKEEYSVELFELVNLKADLKKILKHQKKLFNLTIEKVVKDIEDNNVKITKKEINIETLEEKLKNHLDLIKIIDGAFEKDKNIENDFSFVIKNLNVFYGEKQALFDININIPKNKVISIIGPSGCGKSTFLRTLNRINDEISVFSAEGEILLDGEYDIYKLRSIKNKNDKIEITELRTKIGMIFQQPNPFPMSIAKNVSYGPKINGIKNKAILNELIESSLKDAALWDEVSSNLNALGTSLSGGQQQRLCIARTIANKPEILLMDEPTSALDPIAASKIEDLILKLKKDYTIIIVTHSMQQAARVSDYTAFFYEGELIEFDKTQKIFSNPKEKRTDDYIRGKFG